MTGVLHRMLVQLLFPLVVLAEPEAARWVAAIEHMAFLTTLYGLFVQVECKSVTV